MNDRMLGYLFGVLLLIEGAFLLLPLAVALLFGESPVPYLLTLAALLCVGLPAVLQKPKNTRIYAREGFVCVAAAWILLSAFGALPFVFSGAIPQYIDAFFETVSGFTTTGSTILRTVENLPRGILFWRSFTHWIGGMGVLVFMLAILPTGDGGAIHILRAEMPGPQKSKLVPRLQNTALILYAIYVGLTILQILVLCATGMPFYDSCVNALATAGTGGFAVKNASIAGYANPAAEWVIAVFMLLFGVNFNIYFFLLMRRVREVFHNEELRIYLILCGLSTAIITANTLSLFENFGDALRSAFFQVTSIISTTGFATVDYNTFPALTKAVLLCLTLTGACAGSTAGGLKLSRVLLLCKSMKREVRHALRPRSVNVVRLDGEAVPEETVRGAGNYFLLYAAIIVASCFLLSFDNFDAESTVTAVLTCLNNVGPGLGMVGPAGNFADFSVLSKVVLSFDMLLGRLEIIPIVILFSPLAWKRK